VIAVAYIAICVYFAKREKRKKTDWHYSEFISPYILKPDEVPYYCDIKEAVACHNIDFLNTRIVGEQIKLFQNDNLAIFFFKSKMNDKDTIVVLKHYTCAEDNEKLYSAPLSGSGILRNICSKPAVKAKNGGIDYTEEVRFFINKCSSQFFSVDATKLFIWGISQTEEIKSLKIEGQPVTEVVLVELDGKKVYFWYFDDFMTKKWRTLTDMSESIEDFSITMD